MIFSKETIFKIKFLVKGHRRLVLSCFLFALIFLYSLYFLLPVIFGFNQEYVKTSSLDLCIDNRVARYEKKLANIDAVSYDRRRNNYYLPFVGNGYIGASIDSESFILIKKGKSYSVQTAFIPGIKMFVDDYFHQEKLLLDFTGGKFVKFDCYKQHFQMSLCIAITSSSYAHRTRPELIIQEIKVHNPTKSAIQIRLEPHQVSPKSAKFTEIIKVEGSQFRLYSQLLQLSNSTSTTLDNSNTNWILAVAAQQVQPHILSVPLGGDHTLRHISAVKHLEVTAKEVQGKLVKETKVLVQQLTRDLQAALKKNSAELLKEHETVWEKLWESGITIERSLAPGELNGPQINSTMYYLLSASMAHLHLPVEQLSAKDRQQYAAFLSQSSHCFNGHDSLYAKSLWSPVVASGQELTDRLNRWMLLLHKNGCGRMTRAGADGLVQAIVHSAGSFQHAGDHTAFNMHPADLQRSLTFRRLQYFRPGDSGRTSSFFRVSVDLGEDNRPRLWVSLAPGSASGQLFACDAGCLDDPVQLGSVPVQLPVKLTKPRSALLYVSSQLSHLRELRHIIDVSSIEQAAPHQHHLIALHKHGHASWAGLPPLFWMCIVPLLLIFHLALCRLIYTEYCRYKDDYDLVTLSSPRYRQQPHSSTNLSHSGAGSYYVPSTRRSHYYSSSANSSLSLH